MNASLPARRKSAPERRVRLLIPALSVAFLLGCREAPVRLNEPVEPSRTAPPDDRILRHVYARFVRIDGRVDYAGIAIEPGAVEEYLDQVAATDVAALTPEQRTAFWINAYNALFLRAVSLWHPLVSTRRFPAIDRRVLLHVGAEPLSLAAIRERKLLDGGDPRILFALRTGSRSGPDAGREPLKAAGLDAELRRRTREFLMDSSRNELDPSDGVLELSRLFDRYRDVFGSSREGLLEFIATQRPGLRDALRRRDLVVRWKPWDERLDEAR
ncbi:MAG: DUF547 domain-containing protein [Planctomycetes bacterium]|nr:DUF547 domain-containing protein [Planctomycetota bacterium]